MMNAKRSSKFNLTRYAFLVPAVVVLLLVFSISKAALVKKNNPVVKVFSALTNKSFEKDNSKAPALKPKTVTVTIKSNIAPQKAGKTIDTIKKGKFFLSTSDNSDSLNYVLNGVKTTKAALLKLDENNIYSVNIVPGDAATKLLDHLDNKHSTIFITTDDSESGKKFKAKLDDLDKGDRYTIARGSTSSGNSLGISKVVLVNGTSNGSSLAFNNDSPDNNVTITGSNSRTGQVEAFNLVTKNGSTPATITLRKSSKNGVTVHGYGNGKNTDTTYFLSIDTSAYRSLRSDPVRISYNSSPTLAFSSPKSSINHLSDKLIIINGKIASEADLKKISAFDIDRMVLKTDEETKELYGDKAKNGVVFIVTKKGAKEVK